MKKIFLITFFCSLIISPQLIAGLTKKWPQEAREKIEAYLKSTQHKKHSVAVFDWDNTVIKNDIGDATLFWMVANGKIHNPIKNGFSWESFSPVLTKQAVSVLETACGKKLEYLPTKTKADCADAVLNVYMDELPEKLPAFKENKTPDFNRPDYIFYAQLFYGYTPTQVRKFTGFALKENLKRPVGSKQKIGNKVYNGYIRVYDQIKELVTLLKKHGNDVWILSASIQPTVEEAAKLIGIDSKHVIGVQQEIDRKSGKITNRFQGCGTIPDGNLELINYRQGKRCWLNKIAFKIKDGNEQMNQPSPTSLAAGDSETDVFFLRDAADLRIAINRGKAELMCLAYANEDKKWLVTPMFIVPNSKRNKFNCAKYGLSDQEDRIFNFD